MRRAALLIATGLLAAGCGDDDAGQTAAPVTSPPLPPAATAPPPTETTAKGKPDRAPKRRATVYMLRNGKVVPVARAIGLTAGPGAAALRSLLRGVTESERAAGITTAIAANEFRSLNIKGNRATADFSGPVSDAGVAQVVHTLTEFATVTEVQLRVNGRNRGPVWDRRDLENFAPQILITYPLRGDAVGSPLQITGTANTFEATFMVRVLGPNGEKLAEQVVTATSGSGTRGRFDATLQFDAPTRGRQLTLYAFEPSAQDGRPLHEVRVSLLAG